MNKLEAAVVTYRSLTNKKDNDSDTVRGTLSDEDFARFKPILEQHSLLRRKDESTGFIEFQVPQSNDSFFALKFDDLIATPTRKCKAPEEFYIAELDFFYPKDAVENISVEAYIDFTKLIDCLQKIADHSTKVPSFRAIFLHGEKLDLSLDFKVDDLVRLERLEDFINDFVQSDIHKTQKATIIKGVLFEMLNSGEINRFTLPCITKRFSEFVDRLYANYELYVSEFSFEKIKNQVEKEKFEFILKMNKVFSEIQNQLLAIPAALLLVGSQMSVTSGLSTKNFIIWIGALVFALFISLLIRNQRNTLKAIKLEFDSQWLEIKKKHQRVEERLSEHYEQIINRWYTQKFMLSLISIVTSLSVAASTYLLLYNSEKLEMIFKVIHFGSYGGIAYLSFFILIFVYQKHMHIKKVNVK